MANFNLGGLAGQLHAAAGNFRGGAFHLGGLFNGGHFQVPGAANGGGAGGAADAGAAVGDSGFAKLGGELNDASRALYGGLWSQTGNEGNQGAGSLARYQNDLTAIQTELKSVATPDAHVTAILTDISKALNAAPNTIGNGAGVAAAQHTLQTAHMDILAQVAADPALAQAGVTQVPTALADSVHAQHTTLAQIGALFNDVVAKSYGGVNATTAPGLNAEISGIQADLKQLVAGHQQYLQGDAGALATVHLNTIVNQLELEKDYNTAAGSSSISARGAQDNLLDIVDIIQGDSVLAQHAGNGWAMTPDPLKATTPYQDNAAQTNFWAGFVASSNSLAQQATALIGSHDTAAINALVTKLQNFETNTETFDHAQGGIFSARFDNELLANKSTTGAEVNAIIHGLQTGAAAEVKAGADQMMANAADVSSNNVPVNGGTYNTAGLTVADALNKTTAPTTAAPDLAAAGAAPAGGATNAGSAPATGGAANAGTPAGGPADPLAVDVQHHQAVDVAQHHFGHFWG